jgi:nucleoside triphosphate pyrophosphatase
VTRVVLASASPGRRQVLQQAGVHPLVVVSGVDEDAVTASLDPRTPPEDVVCALAAAKAEDVSGRLDSALAADCVVIGCDSMLFVDGELRGKPDSIDTARRQWRSMAGKSGQLMTGHCVIRLRDNEIASRVAQAAVTTVRFSVPAEADLAAYLDSGEPLRVAGGFTIDGLGGWFIDGVDGDASNVIGLSLPLMRKLLAQLEVTVAHLWAENPQPLAR